MKIKIEANANVVDFLDVTLDLKNEIFKPFTKPNNVISYVNTGSNHPPLVFKNVPQGINDRLSLLSSNEEIFLAAIPPYQKALDDAGYKFKYKKINLENNTRKRNRKKNILWYNPPYSKNVKTKIGKEFLKILDTCFPKSNPLSKIFNRNLVKISYSCMPNISHIISRSNKKKS